MDGSLSKNILATIAYCDALDYPLTSFEIWKYLMRIDYYEEKSFSETVTLSDITEELGKENLRKFIEESGGFYFLKGKSELVEKRIKGNKISVSKIKKLRKTVKILRFVPFVRMIGLTGRLAMKSAEAKSDWDLFVVLKSGKIWTGRTLITLAAHILGKRRHGKKITDRVCLNYFVTGNSLEITVKDLFSASEYFFISPLFDCGGYYRKFQLKNRWISKIKPNFQIMEISDLRTIKDFWASRFIRRIGENIFSWRVLEDWLGKVEKKKISENPKTYQSGSMVQATPEALIFLPEPQGPEIFEKFKKRIGAIG